MVHHASADHVEIDIDQTSEQVFISLNSSRMIAVFPERSLSFLALIEFLRGSAGNQLKTAWDDIWAVIDYQQWI